jgi:hypothetical protein
MSNKTSQQVTKVSISHIFSVEPLKIKMNESEEARAPTLDEADALVKKLFEIYKQQKQQVNVVHCQAEKGTFWFLYLRICQN